MSRGYIEICFISIKNFQFKISKMFKISAAALIAGVAAQPGPASQWYG